MIWAAFEQSGQGATEGMGITTLLGVGNLDPLGPEFPPPAGGSLGPLNETLEAPAIGDSTTRPAIIARSNAEVLDPIGATVQFRQSEGAPTPSGDEIPIDSAHFNASDDELTAEHYILGVNLAGDTPVAAFSGEPLSGGPPLSVAFTDESTNSPTSWSWEKNDGGGWVPFDGTPTAQNPVEDFGPGVWDVRLTACNANGCNTHTENDYITAAITPVAAFTFAPDPAEGCDPLEVTFTDTSTNTPTSWHWEKSDDGVTWVDFDGTPTAQNPVEDFATGTWSVRLTATNGAGSDTQTEVDIVVSAVAPVAAFSGTPLSGTSPLSVAFTDASTNGPTSWHWEKNDGGGWVDFDGTPTAQNPTEDFDTGTWDVRLTVENVCGSDDETKTDYVESAPAVDPHKYWRVLNFATGSANLQLSELQWIEDGVDVTADRFSQSTSPAPTSGAAANLYDGNLSTYAGWETGSGAPPADTYIMVVWADGDFKAITGVKFGQSNDSTRYPVQYCLQWSDDSITWTYQGCVGGLTPPGNNTLSGEIAVGEPVASVHRWNSSDKTAGITLSSSDRIASNGGSGTYQTVRSTANDFNSSGSRKKYGEFVVNATVAGNMFVSMLQTSATIVAGTIPIGFGGPNECANYRNDGSTQLNYDDATGWHRTVNAASTGNWNLANRRVMVAFDEGANVLWWGLNGVWSTGLGGGIADPAAGAFPTYTNMPSNNFAPTYLTDNNGGSCILEIPEFYVFPVPSGFDPL